MILSEDESLELTARQSVYLIGITKLVAAIVSLWTVWNFGRKTLLLFGNIFIAILLFGIAFSLSYKAIIGTVILI